MEMGSRRTINRSVSGNGRSLNGIEVSGSSRSPGCSYLSNVRPENRSTLCSVIAQLTEETQPFFEVTLKSKAVSESCNVKFTCSVTGYPAPQVTWYKDDIQLDRYCGLPKYEIFRNGHNHSLHIYNCAEEDAAIYQASAINNKGIVSCSGVLEVGEMNEFKIHQRYFSKLKQKAENKRREAEEKENQEPARTISPDRAQRKRRSTVGGYISAPSSTEEDTSEGSQQEAAPEVKARVQESSVEEAKHTNGPEESVESHLINGQDAKESTLSTGTHTNDSAQKVLTAHQIKTPFGKTFKISNTSKAGPEEKKGFEKEVKISVTGSELPESPKKSKHVMDSMEVESSGTSTSVLPSFKQLKRRVASIGGKQGPSQEKVDRKTTKGNVKVQNGSPSNNVSPVIPPRASKLQSAQPTKKQDTSTTPKVTGRDNKAQGLSPDMTHTDTSCDSGTALPQPSCQQVRQKPPQKETRPDQKSGRMPVPVQRREATQAHAKAQRNEATVDLELKPKLHTTAAPQTAPSERTDQEWRGPSLHSGLHKAVDNMIQDTQDHSRGSGEICVGPLPDTQKPPLENSSAAENKSKSNVSPAAQRSQPNTPIKTVEGTEIQLHEKVKCKKTNELISVSTRGAQNGEDQMILEGKAEEIAKNIDEMTEHTSQEEKGCKNSVEPVLSGGHGPLQPEENTQITDKADMFLKSKPKNLQKCPSPVPNIISIAELLRSQINALEESVSSRIASIDKTESSTEGRMGSESNTSKTNKDVLNDKGPAQTIKETLMQIYNELIKTKELFADEAPVLSNCTHPLESIENPPSATTEKTLCSEVNEHRATNSLSERASEETGLPLKVSVQEPPDNKSVDQPTPEIKLDCIPVVDVTAPFIHTSKMEELKSNISSLELVQELPVPSALDCVNTVQKNNNATEETEKVVISPPLIPETSPLLEKRDCDSIASATPQELASGARRKIPTHKTKLVEVEPPAANNDLSLVAENVSTSPRLSRHSGQLLPNVEPASPKKKRSPLLSRKKSPVEMLTPPAHELPDVKSEENPANKAKNDPYKAPQVIRKIRGETFADHSGNMKLWCQFFNVLSESTVTWYRDELVIAKMLKSAGDETQVSLALAQATSHDTGVYGCTITNEYGTDSTDFLLSAEVLSGMSLQEDLGVGEEIELTPLIFSKGVADSSVWGNKLFGRIMVQESRLGVGFSHKSWRVKVIYGLEPVFESGNTCIIKVCNPIVYGGKGEGLLIEKNQEGVKQACKIQNLAREYCKIFSTEARAIESFGSSLEVIPVYLMYRPANSIPYATVETDLSGKYTRYCGLDHTGTLDMRSGSEVEQKCCALLHWIFQWTSGNMLFTKLEGVDFKITNVGISVKSHGHQGLPLEGNPKVFEQFVIQHQCNYFCGLLGLRSLKVIESLLMPIKPRGSKSPLVQRKMGTGSSSPQTGRKTSASPRISRKMQQDGQKTPSEQGSADESKDKLSIST